MFLPNDANFRNNPAFSGNCVGSVDRDQLHEADAVIFDVSVLADCEWPRHMSTAQLFVAMLNQPASFQWINMIISKRAKDYFNLSMTYR